MPPGAGTCTSSGVAVIAFVTALGGGTIRDLILGRFPTGWTQHPEYVYLVISAGVLTTVVASFMHNLRRLFLVLDAMGLVAFSLIGCSVAMTMGYPTVVVIMSGMITGICGGILRDVLCNKVPVVFQRELYASVSLAVCALFLGLNALGVHIDLNTAISFTSGLTLRLLAIWGGWRLPTFRIRTADSKRGVRYRPVARGAQARQPQSAALREPSGECATHSLDPFQFGRKSRRIYDHR